MDLGSVAERPLILIGHKRRMNSAKILALTSRLVFAVLGAWALDFGPWFAWRSFRRVSESVSRVRISFAPPLTLAKTDDGPLWGPFFFWFQRGLAFATALRRLAKYPKSVSEPALSLTDRLWPSEGRIQKVYYFQCFGVFEGAPFSKFQAVSKYDANRGTGLRAVVLGGELTFAAVEFNGWFAVPDDGLASGVCAVEISAYDIKKITYQSFYDFFMFPLCI